MRYALTNISEKYANADYFQITSYLSAGLVFTTLAVNSLVYQPQSSKQAAAAGFILLSMIIVSTAYFSFSISLLTATDHLDILLWFYAPSKPPPDNRLVRIEQGRKFIPQQPPAVQRIWYSSWYHCQPASSDVHLCSTQWIRDIFTHVRLPRWPARL
jgi:hypothetical protein